MKKISTLFKREIVDHVIVNITPEYDPKYEWVFTEKPKATRKLDGTAVAIIDGKLYRRLDLKNLKSKVLPDGAIQCQEQPDEITGSFPFWIPSLKKGFTILSENLNESIGLEGNDKYAVEAFIKLVHETSPTDLHQLDGTYELCGPKIQGNPDGYAEHTLVKHGSIILDLEDYSFEGIRSYLETHEIEGIVFHRDNGEMVKIKRSDFGFFWKEDSRGKSVKGYKSKKNRK